jgi:hypothetical protein
MPLALRLPWSSGSGSLAHISCISVLKQSYFKISNILPETPSNPQVFFLIHQILFMKPIHRLPAMSGFNPLLKETFE